MNGHLTKPILWSFSQKGGRILFDILYAKFRLTMKSLRLSRMGLGRELVYANRAIPSFYGNSTTCMPSETNHSANYLFSHTGWKNLIGVILFALAWNFASGQAPSFATKVDFTVNSGSDFYNAGVADFDGDGKLDVATPSRNTNQFFVLRNTGTVGSLGFASSVGFSSVSNPQFVAVGDIDGDGKADIAVSNDNGNSVTVFTNTSSGVGNINFSGPLTLGTNNNPRGLLLADFDGDGKKDIAVACGGGTGLLCVFRNTSTVGSISFAARADFATTLQVWGIAADDLDGDGKNDIAIGAYNQSKLSLFRNTSSGLGNINFAARVDVNTGASTQPLNLSIGDLDGDGIKDIVIPDVASSTVFVFRNTSTVGALSVAAQVNYTIGASAFEAKVADVNMDGKLDIITANLNAATGVSVLTNNCTVGTINFNSKVDFATGSTPQGGSVADLDGDGKLDIVTSNSGAGTISVLRNTLASAPTITSFTPASGPVGTLVTITGTDLGNPTALSIGQLFLFPMTVVP